MHPVSKRRLMLLTALLIFITAIPLRAEYLFLRNGNIVAGTIMSESDASIVLRLPDTTRKAFMRSEVLRSTYNDDFKSQRIITVDSGEEIPVYIVDETRDEYICRKILEAPEEFVIQKKTIFSIVMKKKGAPAAPGRTPAYPVAVDKHRIGIRFGSGCISSQNLLGERLTRWSGFAVGVYYQWKHVDVEMLANIGHQSMGAYAVSILGMVNVYPVPWIGIGGGVHYLLDLANHDLARSGVYFSKSRYLPVLYGISARVWRFQFGFYHGFMVDSAFSYDTGSHAYECWMDWQDNAAGFNVWLVRLEYLVLDYLTVHCLIQRMGGDADLMRDNGVAPAAPDSRPVVIYLFNLTASYAFTL